MADIKEETKTDPAADDGSETEEEVELEGMDMDGIDNADDDDDATEDEDMEDVATAAVVEEEKEEEVTALQKDDAAELEAAKRERMELLAAEQKKAQTKDAPVDPQEKFAYLLSQSDVFAHFLAGSVAAAGKKGKKGGSRGKKNRLTEAEEDAQMLKSAQSKRRTTRLEKQPGNIGKGYTMHKYQLEGLNWMIKLHDCGINGILADEMGLGKTFQSISLLAWLREARGVKGPHIIIVPKSVVGNWCREFKKFCPIMKVVKMGGTKAERHKVVTQDLPLDENGKYRFDALVMSYEALLKEKGRLSKIPWRYLMIDEAHRIKNENSSLSRAIRTMNTEHRLLITGTPLQNNLRELWALLNFLMPDIFGDAEQFDAWFSMNDETGKENTIKKLHTVLRPFMLRRIKTDVATSLPPKKETKLYIGLTKMQQDWYVKVLQKDAHELNKLGGPSRVGLLNILMQLRKVCNHPYLFDGAENGPPYIDGPHLWENCGKMQLLHKLLPKLKAKGSRVLIFSQMTRVLDILEDYFRLVGHDYCRIDGNTDGEKRDSQMDVFNAPGSSKFCFLLSTRAGGLGINLATADIVVLYDSDWNPQVDLQAMDRAHRIGQKKRVQVFRFVAEGTVEEKIIERADRKLFLDAAVIQQGRLAEQHNSLEKNDLMKMVRFGADQILSGKGGTYTDEDIDALIAKGEERTESMQAKLQTDAKHNLANFSLMPEDESGIDTFAFDGKNYRDKGGSGGNFINLPQRQRKRNYDVNEYFRETMNAGGPSSGMKAQAADAAAKKRKKGPALHDFQLFDVESLNAIAEKERFIAGKKEEQVMLINQYRESAKTAPLAGAGVPEEQSKEGLLKLASELEQRLNTDFQLSAEEQEEKAKLQSEGFPDWNKKDFKSFCAALERHGRYDFPSISYDVQSETGKELSEVQRYFVAFWTNYRRLADWKKILEKIEKGEKKILRLSQVRDAIQEKVERHIEDTFGPNREHLVKDGKVPSSVELMRCSWHKMKIQYAPGTRNRAYQEEEDAFLIAMMYRHGYGAAERIRMEIRRAWQFRFDWYFKSRSTLEIQKRCDLLVKVVEREMEEYRKKEKEEEAKQAAEKEKQEGSQPQATAAAAPAVVAGSPTSQAASAAPAQSQPLPQPAPAAGP